MKTRAELGGTLLKAVSRSFYLSIKVLPQAVREPIGLAYLLARASDTIADSAEAPISTRIEALDAFAGFVERADAQPLSSTLRAEKPAEQLLLQRLPDALEWLAAMEPADRAEIQWVLAIIIRGQREDLTRTWPVQSDEALDEYTYQVAGCVGEFWTRICHRHLPRFSNLPLEELSALGIRFGKGLQLVNILRDRFEDEKAGRVYLPGDPAAAAARWTQTAHAHLDAAERYIAALRPWRVRYACILPWQLARMTFALMHSRNGERRKVPRRAVYALMGRAIPAAFSNGALASWAQRSRPSRGSMASSAWKE